MYTRYRASMESFDHYPSYSQIVILPSIALMFNMNEQNWKIEQKSTKSHHVAYYNTRHGT